MLDCDPTRGTPLSQVVLDDVLSSRLAAGTFDVVHDKGTLDAILLSRSTSEAQSNIADEYSEAVARLATPGGILVVTTCNLSAAELTTSLTARGTWLQRSALPYPTLSFGACPSPLHLVPCAPSAAARLQRGQLPEALHRGCRGQQNRDRRIRSAFVTLAS
jgi:hypothetical protein